MKPNPSPAGSFPVILTILLLASACTVINKPVVKNAQQSQKLVQPTGGAPLPVTTLVYVEPTFPAVTWDAAPPCDGQQDCASLYITQEGRVQALSQDGQGLRAAAVEPETVETGPWVIDTGSASPDGRWAAFTSLGNETGGPVFVMDLQSGEWVNLIDAINGRLGSGEPPLPADRTWEVVGWFPDGKRILISSADTSSVVIVDLESYAARRIGYPGGGLGGAMFTHLAPDGSRFVFAGFSSDGEQMLGSYDFASNEVTILKQAPFDEGVLYFPRVSPDGSEVAYLLQKGQPDSGMSYSINLLPQGRDQAEVLVDGNLGMTTLAWSPDGRAIAFTRKEPDVPDTAAQGLLPQATRSNVWIVTADDGQQTQITFIDGQARSPVWAWDGKTLAFITHDGQVGMASTDQPGRIWQASRPAPDAPELTSVFFMP